MFNLGFGEILVIAFIFIIVVGPDRLPELFRTLGKTLRTVQKANRDMQSSIGLDTLRRELLYPSDLLEKSKWLPKPPLNSPPEAPTTENAEARPSADSKDANALSTAAAPQEVDKGEGGVSS